MVRNQSEYIRRLIREDIKKSNDKNELTQIKILLRKILNDTSINKPDKQPYKQQKLKPNKTTNTNNLDMTDINQIRELANW